MEKGKPKLVGWRDFEEKETIRFKNLMHKYCLGNSWASKLCEDFLYVAHIWDDLYDQDKDRNIEEVNWAFCKALGAIPMNPIYQEHVQAFSALTLMAAMTWQIANRFENGNDDEKIGSFILRNTLLMIVYFTILVSGAKASNDTWGINIGEDFFREMF